MTTQYELAREQPYGVSVHTADNIAIVQMIIPRAGTIVPQHAHAYDHTTMVAVGTVRASRDGHEPALFHAGQSIFVPAGALHCLEAVVDNTVCYCVHNVSRSGGIEVLEENTIGCTRAPGDE